MRYTILDCYTDEASGLGVPPYLGTYPRYIYGQLKNEKHSVRYITIDDVRLWKHHHNIIKETSEKEKTNIRIYNLTINKAEEVLEDTDALIIILGVHVPGKYLSALPGTLSEIWPWMREIKCQKILTGPAILGTQLEGGKKFEKKDLTVFDEVKDYTVDFERLEEFLLSGVEIVTQIPAQRIIEIETGRGCGVGKCSFCTEPIKSKFINRRMENVVQEVKAYYEKGCRMFRLGKQADFYACDRPIEMLKKINSECPDLKMLHIDNVNPNSVISAKGEEITRAIVKYCTAGNVAALGIESFDPEVVNANRLNTSPLVARKAIEVINKYGSERGENGMHKFLPGINIIFGLWGETKETHRKNMEALQGVLNSGLLLRRINIRQVAVFAGTYLEERGGLRYYYKNKKYYWKWRNQIRQEIDNAMLGRILPKGTILRDVYTEIYDGKTTFCRQYGTYPLVIGVKGRIPLRKNISVRVKDYMLRSIVGEEVLG